MFVRSGVQKPKKEFSFYIEEAETAAESSCVKKVALLDGEKEEAEDCFGKRCKERIGKSRTS